MSLNESRFNQNPNKGVEKNQKSFHNLIQLAKQAENNRDYKAAIKYYSEAINKPKANVHTYNALGRCLIETNKFEQALELYSQALKKFKRSNILHGKLAELYLKVGNRDKSIRHYQKSFGIHEATPKHFYQAYLTLIENDKELLYVFLDRYWDYIENNLTIKAPNLKKVIAEYLCEKHGILKVEDWYKKSLRKEQQNGVLNRTTVLQSILDKKSNPSYLEIGVRDGENFFCIEASRKVAVDPFFQIPREIIENNQGPTYHEVTSDEFFNKRSNKKEKQEFDVIFIDGLHTYEQSYLDVIHSLEHLKDDGVIILHDCYPLTEAAAQPSLSEARKMDPTKLAWNGNVWKSIIALRSLHKNLDVFVLDTDHGLGVVKKGQPESMLTYTKEDIDTLGYSVLADNPNQLLNKKEKEYFHTWLLDTSMPKLSSNDTEQTNEIELPKNDLSSYFLNNDKRMMHKWLHYFEVYNNHFHRFRNRKVRILEIGVRDGGSLQMWKSYFGKQAEIFGVDINRHCKSLEEDQIKIFIGDQGNEEFLKNLKKEIQTVDILIDDGGHTMTQQILTLQHLYDCVSDDGVYLCEDIQTSYINSFGGGYKKKGTFVEYCKDLIDLLHAWSAQGLISTEFVKRTISAHFYPHVVVLEKRKCQKPLDQKKGQIVIHSLKTKELLEYETIYIKKLEDEGENKNTLKLLAYVYLQQKQYQKANDIYLRALEQGEDPESFYSLAEINLELGKLSQAIVYLKKSLELSQHMPFYIDEFKAKKQLKNLERKLNSE